MSYHNVHIQHKPIGQFRNLKLSIWMLVHRTEMIISRIRMKSLYDLRTDRRVAGTIRIRRFGQWSMVREPKNVLIVDREPCGPELIKKNGHVTHTSSPVRYFPSRSYTTIRKEEKKKKIRSYRESWNVTLLATRTVGYYINLSLFSKESWITRVDTILLEYFSGNNWKLNCLFHVYPNQKKNLRDVFVTRLDIFGLLP